MMILVILLLASCSTTVLSLAVPVSQNAASLRDTQFPRTWVPIASTFELDPDRPTPVEFLEQKYVAYRDNSENWVVMDDVCPHRFAPLSEGRVDRNADTIQCSYHGWEFDSKGTCVGIPQLTKEAEKSATSLKRSCASSYPCTVEKNVLWIWPWEEDVLSVVGDPLAHPEGMLESIFDNPSTYTRDLPYGWDTLMENLIDPAHIPFAHHNLQGKRTDAIPINMTVPSDQGVHGFTYKWEDRTMGMMRTGDAMYRAPFLVDYNGKFMTEGNKPFRLSVICIPTKPGWSRAIIFSPGGGNNQEMKAKTTWKGKLFRMIPVWLSHQFSNIFFDSDLAFLHFQEQVRVNSDRDYYMPAPADRCVSALRKWLSTYTNSTQSLPPPLPRSVMFDRWTQHTSHCKHCQEGLAKMKKYRRSTYAALALSIFGIKFRLAKVTTLLCLGILRLMQKLENSFRVGEYKHYENH